MIDTGRVISTAFQLIDGFTKPSKEVIKGMEKMANAVKKNAGEIQRAGKAISSVGSAMTKSITLPIAGAATAAVKTAADFEASMSKVGAIAGTVADNEISDIMQKAREMGLSFKEGTNATETAMNILKSKAQQMGATTAFSASESAEAMQYMAMAGWKTTDMMDGIAGIMNLAAASGEDLATTSDIVTDALTAFGMKARESSRLADVMATTSSNANTNVALMGETFKYCASTAGAMGYSIEDISVAIGIMGNAGIKGSTAGTTLKNTIANLAKPTDSQAEVMKKLGISLTDNSGNMKSFGEVMENLRSSFSGLSETEKAAAATTLAGKQSMAGLLTIVNASDKDFGKLTKAIKGSSGSAEEMASKMLDNLNGQLTLLKSAAEGIAITIGNKLMPYVKTGVSWVQKAADYINNLNDAQLDNIIKWAGIVAAIGPIILIFGKVVTTVGRVQKAWGGAIKLFTKFKGAVGLITSPAGIVIGVLAAIALGAVLVVKNWDKIKPSIEKLKPVGASIKKIAQIIEDVLIFTIRQAAPVIKKYANAFAMAFRGILNNANGLIKSLQPVFKFIGNIIKNSISVDIIKQAISGVIKVFDGLIDFITGVFTGNWKTAWTGVKNIFKGIFDTFAAICKVPINAVISIINGAISRLNKISVNIPDWVPKFGGKTYGINLPTIPLLYKGTNNWQGGAAIIHDRGGEVVDLPRGSRVYPHDKSIEIARKEGERKGTGLVQITIQKLADKIEVRNDGDIDRIVDAFAYRLEKVALNMGKA